MSNEGLWAAVLARERAALFAGALTPIASDCQLIEQDGLELVIRVVEGLASKAPGPPAAADGGRPASEPRNPFLPPDPRLTVARVGPEHLCVLNKYPVIPHHLLLLTRQYQPQLALLTRADLAALGACLAAADGLGFYNGGPEAGASQPHKHLQVVPLPLGPGAAGIPLEPALRSALGSPGQVVRSARLPFAHALIAGGLRGPEEAGPALERYLALLRASGIGSLEGLQSAPYNLLLSRDWMLLVPRTREAWEDIAVNALGFAGALLARDWAQAARIRALGPLQILRSVTPPPRD